MNYFQINKQTKRKNWLCFHSLLNGRCIIWSHYYIITMWDVADYLTKLFHIRFDSIRPSQTVSNRIIGQLDSVSVSVTNVVTKQGVNDFFQDVLLPRFQLSFLLHIYVWYKKKETMIRYGGGLLSKNRHLQFFVIFDDFQTTDRFSILYLYFVVFLKVKNTINGTSEITQATKITTSGFVINSYQISWSIFSLLLMNVLV